jgi:hypothetical protein
MAASRDRDFKGAFPSTVLADENRVPESDRAEGRGSGTGARAGQTETGAMGATADGQITWPQFLYLFFKYPNAMLRLLQCRVYLLMLRFKIRVLSIPFRQLSAEQLKMLSEDRCRAVLRDQALQRIEKIAKKTHFGGSFQ